MANNLPPTLNGEVCHDGQSSYSSTTVVLTLTADVVGNFLAIGCMVTGASTPIFSSGTDSRGNSYASAQGNTFNALSRAGIIVGRIDRKLKAGDTVSLTFSQTVTRYAVSVLDYSNAHLTATSVDQSTFNSATSTAPTVTSGATTVNDEIVIGFTGWIGGTGLYTSAGSSTTQRGTITTDGTLSIAMADKTVSATGTQTASATLSSSVLWNETVICVRGSKQWYVDFNAADNTGAGTSWATAKKNLSSISPKSGDYVWMAKSTAPTALTGTLTFTDNSTSVATSADLTGSLAAKDMIGPYTGSDVLAGDGWWEVSSLTSSTITLALAYTGTTRTNVTAYLYDGFDVGAPATSATTIETSSAIAGTAGSPVTVIGGYNTSNDTRDGMTHWRVTGATKNGQLTTNTAYQYVSYIGISRAASAFTLSAAGCKATSCFTAACAGNTFVTSNVANPTIIDTCYVYQNTTAATASIQLGGHGHVATNCTLQGAGASVIGIRVATGQGCEINGCTLRRGGGISLSSRQTRIINCTVNNSQAQAISYSAGAGGGNVVSGGTYSSNGVDFLATSNIDGADYFYNVATSSTTSYSRASGSIFYIDRENQVAGAHKTLRTEGTIVTNTAQARSDTCVEMQPNETAFQGNYLDFLAPIPVDASSATRTVTVYLMKSSTWNGGTILAGLRKHGVYVSGGTNVTHQVLSSGYTLLTFTHTMVEIGAIELCIQVDGTAGSIYVDDISWT